MQSTFHNRTSKGTGSNLCTIEPQLWQSSERDATVYPGRCRPPPRSVPFAPLRPNTAAPILRTSARVHVPVSPNPPLPSSPPFKSTKLGEFWFLIARSLRASLYIKKYVNKFINTFTVSLLRSSKDNITLLFIPQSVKFSLANYFSQLATSGYIERRLTWYAL